MKRKLYLRQGVAQYWLVDPDAESVDVWDRKTGGDERSSHAESLPVRLQGHSLGKIQLPEIFAPEISSGGRQSP
ncbi:MAG: Uma2 family endonuclease [Gemmatimonadota bacterium]|nr:MAG: Uma2 family endonuclease [Gemmatimonadota bacterium]